MSDPLRPLRVNAVEMLRQPGAVRTVEVAIEPALVDVVHERLAGDITVELALEATNDAIKVGGTVRSPWSGPCRRCLRDVNGVAVADVDELYQREVTDDEAFLIEANQLDLVPVVRQAILIELDGERLCSLECAGLCPVCGADHNLQSCDCVIEVRDERWAALDGLVVDE